MSVKELSKYTIVAKYANYLEGEKRRETWAETVSRVKNMHISQYPQIAGEIEWAFEKVYDKMVLPAMRTLQYGGAPILKNNCRSYNCAASYCDRVRFFQEMVFILLSGTGAGFSLQKHHIEKLPEFKGRSKKKKKFTVPDSISGWSDAFGVLISSYVPEQFATFPEYSGFTVDFDYSLIRPKGSPISSGGKAPGPVPLINAIIKCEQVIENRLKTESKLHPIDCYDIIMHSSDCVISGGIRRCIAKGQKVTVKGGAQKNIESVTIGDLVLTNNGWKRVCSTFVQGLQDTVKITYENGEVACTPNHRVAVLSSDQKSFRWKEAGKLSKKDSLVSVDEKSPSVLIPIPIISVEPHLRVPTFDIEVEEDHCFICEGVLVHNSACLSLFSIDDEEMMNAKTGNWFYENPQRGRSNNSVLLDRDNISVSDFRDIIKRTREFGEPGFVFGHKETLYNPCQPAWAKVLTPEGIRTFADLKEGSTIWSSEGWTKVVKKWSTGINKVYKYKTSAGVFYGTENHRVVQNGKKVEAKDASHIDYCVGDSDLPGIFSVDDDVQKCGRFFDLTDKNVPTWIMRGDKVTVHSFLDGLMSNILKTSNPTRLGFTSRHLSVLEDIQSLFASIGRRTLITTNGDTHYLNASIYDEYTFPILSIELISEEETFDITVDNSSHTYWTQGCNVSNCVEACLYGYDDDGNSGWQMCNLTIINGKKNKTKEQLISAAHASAIIGTCQAGYCSFPYLGKVTERIVSREALLGCSITGMMDNSDLLFDTDVQKEIAQEILKKNEEIGRAIGVNPCARSTLLKPEGSSSAVLGTSSGIHPHHARRYFRRVQANKTERIYNYFSKFNPTACEESVWSANKTDAVITFCVEVEKGSKLKNDLNAIEMLEKVKSTQTNWIEYGTRKEACVQPWLRHSVSNTVSVKEDEWDDVANYLYENREYFAGVSLLPMSGDKDYPQAPFCAVYTSTELLKTYGDGVLFCSGLIERALRLFDGNLWRACDFMNGVCTAEGEDYDELLSRAATFSFKYFMGDIKKMTYALKDVYNLKLWNDLQRDYQEVDYTKMIEETDNTNFSQESACSGGKCEII